MKSILDPSFNYVPAASTDLRKTFARIRREMKKQQIAQRPSVTDISAGKLRAAASIYKK